MRQWIDLFEAKMVDGFICGPSARELHELARFDDLRGVACADKVYLARAEEAVHSQMRSALGLLPLHSRENPDGVDVGFDFYVGPKNHNWHSDDRFDWFDGNEAHFSDDDLLLNVMMPRWGGEDNIPQEIALRNAQFRRMVAGMNR